jgi:hypothetical protein
MDISSDVVETGIATKKEHNAARPCTARRRNSEVSEAAALVTRWHYCQTSSARHQNTCKQDSDNYVAGTLPVLGRIHWLFTR